MSHELNGLQSGRKNDAPDMTYIFKLKKNYFLLKKTPV